MVHRTNNSADKRRDCGKKQFLDGNQLAFYTINLWFVAIYFRKDVLISYSDGHRAMNDHVQIISKGFCF